MRVVLGRTGLDEEATMPSLFFHRKKKEPFCDKDEGKRRSRVLPLKRGVMENDSV